MAPPIPPANSGSIPARSEKSYLLKPSSSTSIFLSVSCPNFEAPVGVRASLPLLSLRKSSSLRSNLRSMASSSSFVSATLNAERSALLLIPVLESNNCSTLSATFGSSFDINCPVPDCLIILFICIDSSSVGLSPAIVILTVPCGVFKTTLPIYLFVKSILIVPSLPTVAPYLPCVPMVMASLMTFIVSL